MFNPDKSTPSFEQAEEYKYFDEKRVREDVFMFLKGLSEYVHEEKIKNLIFVDSSARPAYIGVNEYLNIAYPETEKPKMYFINPEGFKTQEYVEEKEQQDDNRPIKGSFEDFLKGIVFAFNMVKSDEDTLDELEATFKELIKHKSEALLIFDTCAHTGGTLKPVSRLFEKAGFEDVRIITADDADPESNIITAKNIKQNRHLKGCYMFGRDSMTSKSDSIISEPNEQVSKSGRKKGALIRQEIKRIVHDHLAGK